MYKLFIPLLLFLTFYVNAQNIEVKSYKKEPVWIAMMDDENVNYFEAIKAYDTYWQFHEKPTDEEKDLMPNGKDDVQEYGKKLSKKEIAELELLRWMRFQVKRFERWRIEVLPYVQDDGRILTMDEQIKIWEQVTGKSAK